MPYKTFGDIGGFGRLSEAQRWVTQQERLDVKQEQDTDIYEAKLKQLRLQNEASELNINKVKSKKEFDESLVNATMKVDGVVEKWHAAMDFADDAEKNPAWREFAIAERQRRFEKGDELTTDIAKTDPKEATYLEDQLVGGYFRNRGQDKFKIDYIPKLGKAQEITNADGSKSLQYLEWDDTKKDHVWIDRTPEGYVGKDGADKKPELKDKDLRVVHAIAPLIESGTATEEQVRQYKLAEQNYTSEKITSDPETGQQIKIKKSLPAGFPSFQKLNPENMLNENREGLPPGTIDRATGLVNIKPVGDLSRITKAEVKEHRKAIKPLKLMKQQLLDIRNEVEEKGTFTTDIKTIARRKSAYNDMLMNYKEILNLGVLNGPDLMIMERILKDPTGVSSMALGSEWVVPSYNNVLTTIDRNLGYINEATGGVVGEVAEPDPKEKIVDLDDGQKAVAIRDPDGKYRVRRTGQPTLVWNDPLEKEEK